jgi:hypothetical protein
MAQLGDSAYRKEMLKERAQELAMDYLEDNPGILQAAQAKMSLLMKKFSVVPNSADLSTAVKRTSLKGKDLSERLVGALNFQLISIDPVSIDLRPMLGYRINSRWEAGVGGSYRKLFSDSIVQLAPDVTGFNLFSSYDVLGNFFAYGEYAQNSTGYALKDGEQLRDWSSALLVGAGKRIPIGRSLVMTLTGIYRVGQTGHDPVYPRPLSLRVGFGWRKE